MRKYTARPTFVKGKVKKRQLMPALCRCSDGVSAEVMSVLAFAFRR